MLKQLIRVCLLFFLILCGMGVVNDPAYWASRSVHKEQVIMIVTIDWEKEKPEIGSEDIYESIEETTQILLDIFKEHEITATFLVEYDSMADMFQFNSLINRMVAEGHEIGLHFHGTDWYTYAQMKEWLLRAQERARKYNQKLVSFRAGCFIMTEELNQALKDTQFMVDLSKAPGCGCWNSLDTAYWDDDLLVLPLTCSQRGYLNFYNITMELITAEKVSAGKKTLVLYFHNWNIIHNDLTLDEEKIADIKDYFTFIETMYDVQYMSCKEYYALLKKAK
jgi:hypothetical protein